MGRFSRFPALLLALARFGEGGEQGEIDALPKLTAATSKETLVNSSILITDIFLPDPSMPLALL
jgi:hypothetical protein